MSVARAQPQHKLASKQLSQSQAVSKYLFNSVFRYIKDPGWNENDDISNFCCSGHQTSTIPASLTPTHNLPVRHLDVFKVLQVLMGFESF